MKEKQIIPTNMDYVIQPNQISRASYMMPILQRRLIYLAMAQIRLDDTDLLSMEMSIGNVMCALNMEKSEKTYEEIRATIRGLMEQTFEIEDFQEWKVFHWLHNVVYDKKKDTIKIRLHNDLKPYLLALKEVFTLIKINDITKLQSKYALRIFELIMSRKEQKNKQGNWWYDTEFEHLRHLFKIEKNEYKLTNNFRRWVIDNPVKEINQAEIGIHITPDYTSFRRGRKLLGVRLNCQLVQSKKNEKLINKKEKINKEKKDEYSTADKL